MASLPGKSVALYQAVQRLISPSHHGHREVLLNEVAGLFLQFGPVNHGQNVTEKAFIGRKVVVFYLQRPVFGKRIAQSRASIHDDRKPIEAGFERENAQPFEARRHEQEVECGKECGQICQRFADGKSDPLPTTWK